MVSSYKHWPFLLLLLAVIAGGVFLVSIGCGDLEAGPLASITISPATTTIGINQSSTFTAIGKDSSGKIVTPSITWSVTGGIGSVTSAGLFTAGASEGPGHVVASAEGISGEAAVTITFKGWVKGTVIASNGSSTSGLQVYLNSSVSGLSTSADSSGRYTIENVPAGDHIVYVPESTAFYQGSSEVTVASGETKSSINVYVNSKLTPIPTTTLPF
jgi:hypothetical protein